MKTVTFKRKIDKLGRITLPNEIRDSLNILNETELNISVKNEEIILTKSNSYCVWCGKINETQNQTKEKYLCDKCIEYISSFHKN